MRRCDERCAEPAAYMRHRRAGEDPCAAAKKAWRERQREYRMRKEVERDDPAE